MYNSSQAQSKRVWIRSFTLLSAPLFLQFLHSFKHLFKQTNLRLSLHHLEWTYTCFAPFTYFYWCGVRPYRLKILPGNLSECTIQFKMKTSSLGIYNLIVLQAIIQSRPIIIIIIVYSLSMKPKSGAAEHKSGKKVEVYKHHLSKTHSMAAFKGIQPCQESSAQNLSSYM